MLKHLSILLALFPLVLWGSCEELEGLWEGYQFHHGFHASHILELDSECAGFYAYALGEHEAEMFVIPVGLTDGMEANPPYFAIRHEIEEFTQQALFVPAPGPVISVITSNRHGGRNIYAITWKLSKVRTVPRNSRLYEFAKNAL